MILARIAFGLICFQNKRTVSQFGILKISKRKGSYVFESAFFLSDDNML